MICPREPWSGGTGNSAPPVVFSHGWPLNADAWDDQEFFVASHSYRAIAHDRRGHDRRGHGRSAQPWAGNEMDTYADDLADPRRGHESTLEIIELGEQLGFDSVWVRHRHLQFGISSPVAGWQPAADTGTGTGT